MPLFSSHHWHRLSQWLLLGANRRDALPTPPVVVKPVVQTPPGGPAPSLGLVPPDPHTHQAKAPIVVALAQATTGTCWGAPAVC